MKPLSLTPNASISTMPSGLLTSRPFRLIAVGSGAAPDQFQAVARRLPVESDELPTITFVSALLIEYAFPDVPPRVFKRVLVVPSDANAWEIVELFVAVPTIRLALLPWVPR